MENNPKLAKELRDARWELGKLVPNEYYHEFEKHLDAISEAAYHFEKGVQDAKSP